MMDPFDERCKKALEDDNPQGCIQAIAENYSKWFVRDKRPDGEEFVKLKKDAPEELRNLVREVHGPTDQIQLPDDHTYKFIEFAIDHIVDNLSANEDADLDEAAYEITADVYNKDLLEWLGSNVQRVGYVDEATKELGMEDYNIMRDIGLGQEKEKQEVYGEVLQKLRNKAETFR